MQRDRDGDDAGSVELQGGFIVDLRCRELRDASGHRVTLAPQPFAVLMHLAEQAGRLVGKEALMQAAWPGVVVTDDSLVQCIKLIRRALGDDAQRLVQTESKRGYRLAAASQTEPSAAQRLEQRIAFTRSADGTRIAYATAGQGPPLVRAGHMNSHLEFIWSTPPFADSVQRAARRYRLLRYDPRGWGLSDRGFTRWSLDDQVADLEAVVDAAGSDTFALLGAANGGLTAIRYAARHPERVTHLVLCTSYARGSLRRGADSRPADVLAALARVIEDGWASENPAVRQTITSYLCPAANIEQQRALGELQQLSCTPKEAALYWDASKDEDLSAELAQVRCPTLVLHSRRCSEIPFEEGRHIAAGIPGARFEPLDSANLMLLPDEPAFERVFGLLDEFLLPPANVHGLRPAVVLPRPVLRAAAAPAPKRNRF